MGGTVKIRPWSVLLWLAVWQAASLRLDQELLLVSPLSVISRLLQLAAYRSFWQSILFSLGRILTGFFLAALTGTVLAALSSRYNRTRELLAPLILTVKAVPVASFIILVLIWIPSRSLSVVISFLMVLPVIYTNVLDGIFSTSRELLEMAQVFQLSAFRKIRYLYVSQALPFFRSACSISLGLCWKSGIAAEVIGISKGSIGEKLYNAKIYLNTPDLFAWTLVIVLISLFFEKLLLTLLDQAVRRLERINPHGYHGK